MSHSQRTASEVIGKLGGQYPGELTISTPKKRCPFSPTHFVFFKSPGWEKKKKRKEKPPNNVNGEIFGLGGFH